ncbi:phosphate ABC transporter substrate-binding protein [Dapis sp. BLCC M229]|uniref:phosphate ABC transporter substrate-binding protein n=1 Tax=Dapis sp. BLCC M229 TaxID=3400188 RepID=UPI003CF9AC60
MTKSSGLLAIVFILLFILLGGGGYWFLLNQNKLQNTNNKIVNNPTGKLSLLEEANQIVSNLDISLPNPNVLAIDGSVTMVKLIKILENAYEQKYPSIPVTYGVPEGMPNGSNQGIKNLLTNQVQIAAISRPLQPEEALENIKLIPIAKDALVIVVGINNPYKGGLTLDQLKDIYQGKITNWLEVGGDNLPIKVINRSSKSGSYNFFQDFVLLGESFAPNSANFITYKRDVTTPILRELKTNGISYTTIAQAKNQTTVRIVPINGISPVNRATINNYNYPLTRHIFLAVPNKTSLAVKKFLEFAVSNQGQNFVQQVDFVPLK